MIVISPVIRLVGRIASFVLYLVTILASFGGRVNPALMAFPSLMVLALPYLVIATLIVSLCWLIGKRLVTGGIGIASLLLCWSAFGPAVPIATPSKADPGQPTFKLLTFNSLHLQDIKHPDESANRAARFLLNSGADVICLQELLDWNDTAEIHNLSRPLLDSLFSTYPYQAGTRKTDLKVLSKYPVTLIGGGASWAQNKRLRFCSYRLEIEGRRVGLINMHLASYSLTEKERQIFTDIHSTGSAKESYHEFKGSIFQKLRSSFQERSENVDSILSYTADVRGPLIVCGDFNDVPASWAYRKMIQGGFRDAYAETSFGPAITYNQHLFLFHLDQIFYRGAIKPLWVHRLSHNTSDHYPLEAEFQLE